MKRPWHQQVPVVSKERRTFNGVVYASGAEAKRAFEHYYLLKSNGRIVYRQVEFQLGPDHTYIADFYVDERGRKPGEQWAEEIKGYTGERRFAKIKKLWRKYGTMPLVVLTPIRGGWKREVIYPNRAPVENER